MSQKWNVYNLFASSPDVRNEIVEAISFFAKTLIKNGDLADFYYNLYYIPPKVPPHVRFGFYKLRDEIEMKKKFGELKDQGKITKVEATKPDLGDVDGVAIDKIKLTARKITELIKADFKECISRKQAFYLIHLSMNPLFGYIDEREIYLSLTKSMEKAIREHSILADSEDPDNWSVFLFDCPKDKVAGLLVMLFKHVKEIVPYSLPNYTMRYWDEKSIKVSLRVLRDKKEKDIIKLLENSIAKLLRKEHAENIIVNPQGEDAKISGWSKAPLRKCKAYNRLSEFVVKLAEDNLLQPNDRNEMRHLAINMLFMREAAKAGEQYAFFVDLISGNIFPQPYPLSICVKPDEKRRNIP